MDDSISTEVVKPWQVALQLARLEARKVGFHPATLLGVALTVWVIWELNTGQTPVLNRVGSNISLPLVLLAGAALIATSGATVRIWKTTTTLEAIAALGVEPLAVYQGRIEGPPWPDYPPCP